MDSVYLEQENRQRKEGKERENEKPYRNWKK